MCSDDRRALSFEAMLTDPLIKLVMKSDGITSLDVIAAMEVPRAAIAAREISMAARRGMPIH